MIRDIRFCECEHPEDLDDYADAVHAAGAKVVARRMDGEESGVVTIEVADQAALEAFVAKFRQTEPSEFSSLGGALRA